MLYILKWIFIFALILGLLVISKVIEFLAACYLGCIFLLTCPIWISNIIDTLRPGKALVKKQA